MRVWALPKGASSYLRRPSCTASKANWRCGPGHKNGEAEEHFRRAIGTARHQLSKAWELRATTSLARLCQQQGRRDEAREMLSDAYGRFTEGFDCLTLRPPRRCCMSCTQEAV